jgi:putative membrane protein
MQTLTAVANYLIYLALSGVMLVFFFVVYTRCTPFDEVLLIRQGNTAAAFSLGGAILGFSLTVASCIFHTSNYVQFFGWASAALVVQLLAYLVTARCMAISKEHIESNNVAFGALLGVIALAVGAINAACIS